MSKKKNNVTLDDIPTLVEDTEIAIDYDVIEDNYVAETEIIPKITYNTQSCKVLAVIAKDKVIIDFDGRGIIATVADTKAKTVNIKYAGKIGTSDFMYEVM
jgi:hypothetical protein